MKETKQMGLGNTLEADTEILHSGIIGKSSLGRICDVVALWCEKNRKASFQHVSDARLMVQALLDFSHVHGQSNLGQFEFSIEAKQMFVCVRIENQIFSQTDSVERTLSQYWLNSEEASMLKKLLYPKDKVEVRFNQKLNLIEWRVCRSLKPGAISHEDVSFVIMLDEELVISTQNQNYTDLGDLPYQDWMNAIYRNQPTDHRSGEFFVDGESLQNEAEWARVVADKEARELDEEVRFKANEAMANDEPVVIQALTKAEDDVLLQKSERQIEVLKEKLSNAEELRQDVKDLLVATKKDEFRALREVAVMQQKIQKLEALVLKKEKKLQKSENELRIVNKKISEQVAEAKTAVRDVGAQNATASSANSFREKAMQMFEQLKAVKTENQALEKRVAELSRGGIINEVNVISGGSTQTMDDVLKKAERTQRALEAEKAKVKSLSERVIVAEKEAQSSGPTIDELERKVETTLKTAQQHKKETEQVKQKLVQADAEKNKVKNELVKAQAQIQTLMKRHAS